MSFTSLPLLTDGIFSGRIESWTWHRNRCPGQWAAPGRPAWQKGEGSIASISVRFNKTVWIEDLIEIAESSASSSIYSLLKREDEKYITEYAYDNPAFVEDIVRNITEKLMNDSRIIWFEVECENMESIHNHNAWARIERWK